MSLEDIFNSIGLFFEALSKSISNFFHTIWTANLYNEIFLKIIIFIVVIIFTSWALTIAKNNAKKIEASKSKLKFHKISKKPLSEGARAVGILVFSYAVTGLIVMFFDIDKINN